MDDFQELFDELYPEEISAETVQDMVAALRSRLAAAERGDLALSAEERTELEGHLRLLTEEMAIAQFVEESLRQAVTRRKLLDALSAEGEGE